MSGHKATARRWALLIGSGVTAWLLYGVAGFAWSTSNLKHAAAEVEQAGAEVKWVMFGPEYIYFKPATNDATLEKIRPALDKLWTVTEVHLEGSAVTDFGLMCLSGMQSLHCIVVTDTAVNDVGIREMKRYLNRGHELQVIR